MKIFYFTTLLILTSLLSACQNSTSESTQDTLLPESTNSINIVGAMKDVMWNGELAAKLQIESIADFEGLYGVGPLAFLTGEIMIYDGKSYVSRIDSSNKMIVEETKNIGAPFFVYANNSTWKEIEIPEDIQKISELELFIDQHSKEIERPFAFRLEGRIDSAMIHVQNLPKGTEVSSPEEAHQGQVNFKLKHQNVFISGFFSTEHQGIFTHHDSYLHMHLINEEKTMMGHLDKMDIGKLTLFLPEK